MRVALVHAGGKFSSLENRLWDAVCQTWPTADRYSTQFLSTSASHSASPATGDESIPLWGQGNLPSTRRFGSWSTGLPVALSGYDLVISTSLQAACALETPAETLHACYVCGTISGSESEMAAEFHPALRVHQADGATHDLIQAARRWNSVTHVLAASHAAWSHSALNFRPCPARVLPVPVNTTFFRPGSEIRHGNYLLVTQAGHGAAVEMALEACRVLHRPLTIASREPIDLPLSAAGTDVTCISNPEPRELRALYRSCRALLAVETTDYDASLLEAQACGAPVIAYGLSGAAEVVWDAEASGLGTGLLFHELSVPSLVSAMRELERRPQNFSAAISLTHISQYSQGHFEQTIRAQLTRWQREHLDAFSRRMVVADHRGHIGGSRAA